MNKSLKQMDLWERPDHYAGETYYDYYVLLGRHRDSDALAESNFRKSVSLLKEVSPEEDDSGWIIARAGHWAVGWVELLLIHKDNLALVEVGNKITTDLDDYPVLDEDLYSELQIEYGEIEEEEEDDAND